MSGTIDSHIEADRRRGNRGHRSRFRSSRSVCCHTPVCLIGSQPRCRAAGKSGDNPQESMCGHRRSPRETRVGQKTPANGRWWSNSYLHFRREPSDHTETGWNGSIRICDSSTQSIDLRDSVARSAWNRLEWKPVANSTFIRTGIMVERELQFLKERENLLTGIRLLDQLRVKHVSNKHQIGANQQNTIDLQLGILTRIIVQLLGSKFTTLHFPRIGHTH